MIKEFTDIQAFKENVRVGSLVEFFLKDKIIDDKKIESIVGRVYSFEATGHNGLILSPFKPPIFKYATLVTYERISQYDVREY